MWNCAQHSQPHPGKMQGAELRHQQPVRQKVSMATKPCPQRGVTGFGFPGPGRAAGTHKLEKLGCRPKAHCPGSQAPQAPAGKPWKGGRSLGAHLPLPPALGWLLKPGALRRSQPCVWRAVSCGVGGMGVRRDSGSGSRMQARNPERCVLRQRKEDRNPGLL